MAEDRSLDDIISSLNSIREQLDDTFQASASDTPANVKPPNRDERDDASLALEEYLASRLQQIGEVEPQRREAKGLRTGNGWDPNEVNEHVFKIEPVSVKTAIEKAFSSNRSFRERITGFFRRRKLELRVIGSPVVEFVPIWKVKGFHECYYLRTNAYKVNVKNDVVGLEVEGKTRDLILERKHRSLIPSVIAERFQKLASFLTNESKYFVIGDVLELASKHSESELAMTGLGKMLTEEEEEDMTSWRSKRIFDTSDLKVRGARVRVRECTVTKETVLNKFREKVIRMPDRFKQILSNRLQISELKRIYVPFIRISVQKDLVPREIVVNGTTGQLASPSIMELLE